MSDARRLVFPDGFLWGAATAAYQIEGAADEDGRRPSIWDTFSHTPGRVQHGETGDVACDHYHRVEEDLDLMADLGLNAYRFSVAWSRVLPDGSGAVNRRGLDFYDRLVDGLLSRGIAPLLTLYHWDLPQALDDVGGWLHRDTADRFAEFAHVVGAVVGDRVWAITTLNEPFCSAFLGYASGEHAPGVRDNALALTAAHHLNLAHGRAVAALRSIVRGSCQMSITLNLAQVEPETDTDSDRAAAAHVDALANQTFLGPMMRGGYPDSLIADTQHVTDWGFVRDGDAAEIAAPIDFLGVNYYAPIRIAAAQRDPSYTPFEGTDLAWIAPRPGPRTDMGWPIDPDGLTALLTRLHRDHPELPLVITENGCAYADRIAPDGRVHDADRIAYLREHLAAVMGAIDAGVDVRGYCVWSLLDNFEWAWGYSKRFGLVYVDYDTQIRVPKDSAYWFREVIAANGIALG